MPAGRARPPEYTFAMEKSPEFDTFVRAFSRGLDVIEALGNSERGMSISEVADQTGLSRASARRLLMTLTDRGFAASNESSFALSPRILNLGLAYLRTLPFTPYGQPALEELRAATNESCGMAVLDGTDVVYVLRLPSRRILAMNANIGTRLPALNVSLGQVLLSGLSSEAFDTYCGCADFAQRTPKSIKSAAALKRALTKIRDQGYAWVDGELDPAICGIAVPLRDKLGSVIAAINISLVSGMWTEETARERLLPALRHAAEQIRSAMRT